MKIALAATFLLLQVSAAAAQDNSFSQPADIARQIATETGEGDARAVQLVLYALDAWALTPNDSNHSAELSEALHGAMMFHLEQAGPVLVSIYRNPLTPRNIKDQVAESAAAIVTPAAQRFFDLLLDDDALGAWPRAEVTAALAQLGDTRARQTLIDECVRSLGNLGSDTRQWYVIVARMNDPTIRQHLEKLRDAAADPAIKSRIAAVVEQMKVNELPLEELWKMVEAPDWSGDINLRMQALYQIGEKGELPDIDRLQQLRAPLLPANGGRNNFSFIRRTVIVAIRCRHWQQQTAIPATLPELR